MTKAAGCAPAQLGRFRDHPLSRAAMPWDTCPIFAVPVWTSTFSNVSALVVPLSSTVLSSRDSFPSHLGSRHDVTPVVTDLLR
jgi:hypothetical protein